MSRYLTNQRSNLSSHQGYMVFLTHHKIALSALGRISDQLGVNLSGHQKYMILEEEDMTDSFTNWIWGTAGAYLPFTFIALNGRCEKSTLPLWENELRLNFWEKKLLKTCEAKRIGMYTEAPIRPT